jgi:hypothetical protein
MTKQAIVAHAAEWAIVDFGPNFSIRIGLGLGLE